jgi:hypothetical protein
MSNSSAGKIVVGLGSVARYEQLQMMNDIQPLGDIAYYLHYVEDILAQNPNCKFVCIKRDREKTVRS